MSVHPVVATRLPSASGTKSTSRRRSSSSIRSAPSNGVARIGNSPFIVKKTLCGAHQYVARPPLMSNTTAPVLNEHSSDASHATSAATSATSPVRPIGIFEIM